MGTSQHLGIFGPKLAKHTPSKRLSAGLMLVVTDKDVEEWPFLRRKSQLPVANHCMICWSQSLNLGNIQERCQPTEHFDSMQVRYKIGFSIFLYCTRSLTSSLTSTAIWLRILDDHKQKPLLNVFNHLMVSWIRNIIRDCSHKVIWSLHRNRGHSHVYTAVSLFNSMVKLICMSQDF